MKVLDGRLKRMHSPQPAVRSILKNATAKSGSFAMKNGPINQSIGVDPFSKLCQLHVPGSGTMKIIGNDNSIEYLLGLRAVARDVFHEEIGEIAKAVYEEVSFRIGNSPKEKVVTISNPVVNDAPEFGQIERAIIDSLAAQKVKF